MKILIAYDGSPSSDAAVAGLSRAGLPEQADVYILSVAKIGLFPPVIYTVTECTLSRDWLERADALTRAGCEVCHRLSKDFPKWRIRAETVAGLPADLIVEKAENWKPDLIVAGTNGRSPLVRTFLGSVALKLIAGATCTVRIGRPGGRSDGPIELVVGTDGSVEAAAAVEAICSRSWPAGTTVHVVAAFEVVPPTIGELSFARAEELREVDRLERDQLASAVQSAQHKLTAAGLCVSGDVLTGRAADVLLREARELQADAIFLGGRSLGVVESALFGVSRTVTVHAPCAVEVVHLQEVDASATKDPAEMHFVPF